MKQRTGKDLQNKIKEKQAVPDIMVVDDEMPYMDGIATARWLTTHYPGTKLIAFSLNENDSQVIAMIKAGCVAYLSKGIHPEHLELALEEVIRKGYYFDNFDNRSYDHIGISCCKTCSYLMVTILIETFVKKIYSWCSKLLENKASNFV